MTSFCISVIKEHYCALWASSGTRGDIFWHSDFQYHRQDGYWWGAKKEPGVGSRFPTPGLVSAHRADPSRNPDRARGPIGNRPGRLGTMTILPGLLIVTIDIPCERIGLSLVCSLFRAMVHTHPAWLIVSVRFGSGLFERWEGRRRISYHLAH